MAVVPQPHEKYESLRTEYEVANRHAIHCTELNWQVGSILVGGSLAAVALSLTTKAKIPTILMTTAAIVAIFAWFLFLRRNRDFASIATRRMATIEYELGLVGGVQNLILYASNNKTATYPRAAGPAGFTTASFLAFGLISVLLSLIVYLLL